MKRRQPAKQSARPTSQRPNKPRGSRAPSRAPAASYSGYTTWQPEQITLGDQLFTIHTRPGVQGFDAPDFATTLLAASLKASPTDRVLVLNDALGVVAVAAATAAQKGHVQVANPHIVAYEAARRTAEANGVANLGVHLSNGISDLPQHLAVDLVAARLPKGKLPALQLIWDGFQALKPGGRFYLAGANDEGIKSYLQALALLFGEMGVAGYRKGNRVGVAVKPATLAAIPPLFQNELLDHNTFHRFQVQVQNQTVQVCSRPGVFSWDRLDGGTRVLLESFDVGADDTVLDLGCGYGLIGAVAAQRASQGVVYMVDAQIDAVRSAQQTVTANHLTNCQVLASDCAAAVRHLRFDQVLSNPPFHAGKATTDHMAVQFVRDAYEVLKPSGRLQLVANRFLPYEEVIQPLFGNVSTLYQDSRFKVLAATR
jgi:16S rRNA (guanine1207-N2)-methyltransferase